jgi:hypothetical protein
MVLEAVHFLVEIGNPRHTRLSSAHSIRSYDTSAKLLTRRKVLFVIGGGWKKWATIIR